MQFYQITLLLITTILHVLPQIKTCFVVHYVVYFKDIPMKYYLQMSQNSSFPYLVHLNEELNLPDNRTFVREITPVQMSDIKKVQVIYHHGGLYLDNDQFIDYQCVKKRVCKLKGLYFLDWTYIKERWKTTVPLSFIYASDPYNETLKKSLEGLNQSRQGDAKGPRTVYFSGPSHMQEYRSGMSFVRVPKQCEFHRADRSWISGKPANQLKYQRSIQNSVLRQYTPKQKQGKPKFVQLWKTHTVIYPKDFDISIQHRIDEAYNHVEMIDSVQARIKVIQYSKRKETRKLLEDYLKKYQNQNFEEEEPVQVLEPIIEKKVVQEAKVTIKQIKQQHKSTQIITQLPQRTPQKTNIISNTPTPQDGHPTPLKTQDTHITPSKIPHKHPTTQTIAPYNKNLLDFINNYFYPLSITLTILAIGIALICYKSTNCCKYNNYEKRGPKMTIRDGEIFSERGVVELQEEEFTQVPSFDEMRTVDDRIVNDENQINSKEEIQVQDEQNNQ